MSPSPETKEPMADAGDTLVSETGRAGLNARPCLFNRLSRPS